MDNPPKTNQAEQKIFLKRLSQVSLYNLGYAAVLFIAAGTLDWVNAWIYILLQMAIFLIAGFIVQDADLLEERSQVKGDVKSLDKTISFINIGLTLTILVTAGLDYRFGWLPGMPLWINVLGVLMFVLGYAVFVWAMASNTFFSGFVRIQKDRGHAVVSTGPYQYVRHPGYIGGTLSILGVPLLLGSFWALIPASMFVCMLILRTGLEDRTLQTELVGYIKYTQDIPYRLIPGVW